MSLFIFSSINYRALGDRALEESICLSSHRPYGRLIQDLDRSDHHDRVGRTGSARLFSSIYLPLVLFPPLSSTSAERRPFHPARSPPDLG
eukprot:3934188-Rhodomonas_salina.2